eukprot:47155-Lingulodinium_polyedra.AAC.1
MSLTREGAREVAAACEAGKKVMQAKFRAVANEAQNRPLLQSHSCDGTPMNTKRRVSKQLPGGAKVH